MSKPGGSMKITCFYFPLGVLKVCGRKCVESTHFPPG